jgi:hypothetical protein
MSKLGLTARSGAPVHVPPEGTRGSQNADPGSKTKTPSGLCQGEFYDVEDRQPHLRTDFVQESVSRDAGQDGEAGAGARRLKLRSSHGIGEGPSSSRARVRSGVCGTEETTHSG